MASTDSSAAEQWWAWGPDTGNIWRIQPGTGFGGSTGLFIDSTGKVGIGTSAPAYPLDVRMASTSGFAILGYATATTGGSIAVFGQSNSTSGYGVYSLGNARVDGNLTVTGSISAGVKDFKIDHPLDPANKYLVHASIESSDVMNLYNGNAVLGENGEAWVSFPEWFEALNRDFRYQLTAIGAPGPNLYVAEEIQANRFQIAGGKPGMKVSWQVTGIRQDPYLEAHRMKVEENKPQDERGFYLHPEVYGQPEKKGIEYAHRPPDPQMQEKQQGKQVTASR